MRAERKETILETIDATSAQRTIENIAQALRKGTSVDVTSAQKRIESRQFKGRDLT